MTADGRRFRTGGGILLNTMKTREPVAYIEIMKRAKEFERWVCECIWLMNYCFVPASKQNLGSCLSVNTTMYKLHPLSLYLNHFNACYWSLYHTVPPLVLHSIFFLNANNLHIWSSLAEVIQETKCLARTGAKQWGFLSKVCLRFHWWGASQCTWWFSKWACISISARTV